MESVDKIMKSWPEDAPAGLLRRAEQEPVVALQADITDEGALEPEDDAEDLDRRLGRS